jgi:serine phosphatase RsbU (regulator of sigma subunit)
VLNTGYSSSLAWQGPGALSRLLAARTLEDVADVFPELAAGLFPGDLRGELAVTNGAGELVPLVDPVGGRKLLASLRSHLSQLRLELPEPRAFPGRRLAGSGSVMGAPLHDAAERSIGVVVVQRGVGEPDFGRTELLVLENVAAMLSLAVQRLDLDRSKRVRARIEADRQAARRVQRRLMSGSLPPDVGVDAQAEYLPAFDVGGDFYSLKYLGDRKVGLAIGDVSGNGVSAALLMSRVASDLERALAAGDSPSVVLERVNARLSDLDSDRFVTASCIRLDTARRRLTIANAGHLPLVVRHADGHTFACGGASGMPLGMLPCKYAEEEIALRPADVVLLMTDGLVEALDHPSGGEGMDYLLDLVRGAPHDRRAIHARIRETVDEIRRTDVLDDVTWVGLQLEA